MLATVLQLISVSCKKGDTWTEFKSVEGNFAVRFPKPPTELPTSDEKDTVVRNVRVVIDESVVYDVNYGWAKVHMPSGSPNEADFRGFKDAFLENCTTISEGSAAPALPGYIARRLVFHCPNDAGIEVTHSVNLYVGSSRFYAVSILFATSAPEPQESAKFLASFRLLN